MAFDFSVVSKCVLLGKLRTHPLAFIALGCGGQGEAGQVPLIRSDASKPVFFPLVSRWSFSSDIWTSPEALWSVWVCPVRTLQVLGDQAPASWPRGPHRVCLPVPRAHVG